MKAQSDTTPKQFVESRGKVQANYNVHKVEIIDEEGKPKTIYKYDYVEIEGKVTKAKVLAAIQAQKLEEDDLTDWDPTSVASDHSNAETEFNKDLVAMTNEQRDAHIDATVNSLAGARKYLKDLSRIVFAMDILK